MLTEFLLVVVMVARLETANRKVSSLEVEKKEQKDGKNHTE